MFGEEERHVTSMSLKAAETDQKNSGCGCLLTGCLLPFLLIFVFCCLGIIAWYSHSEEVHGVVDRTWTDPNCAGKNCDTQYFFQLENGDVFNATANRYDFFKLEEGDEVTFTARGFDLRFNTPLGNWQATNREAYDIKIE